MAATTVVTLPTPTQALPDIPTHKTKEWIGILSELTVHVTSTSGQCQYLTQMHRVLDRAAVLTLREDMGQELDKHHGPAADRVEEIAEILSCYAIRDNTASDPLRRAILRQTLWLLDECI
jgi:hypothetical protein